MRKAILLFSLSLCWLFSLGQVNPDYTSKVELWHKNRIADLKKPGGWLNLEGLFWLHKGANSFGRSPQNDCVYANAAFPQLLGHFDLAGDSVTWTNASNIVVNCNNQPIIDSFPITIFKEKTPPVIMDWAHFRWNIIKREDKIGVRFRNLKAKNLLHFKGIERFAVDPKWCVQAKLSAPIQDVLMITNVLGQSTPTKNAGKLQFELLGKSYTLDVIDEGGPNLFIAFADLSSGKTTYGAGRFIEVARPDAAGNTQIDFNLAYNPPCAFTPFATCPLPPPQNRLAVEITAGEKNYGHH
ncbi:MAG: hypothetical protein RL034_844 [Bacteroidota bacterium]